MTIPAATAQNLLLTPVAESPEGHFSEPPIAIEPGQPDMPAAVTSDGEFWTLISHNLSHEELDLAQKNNDLSGMEGDAAVLLPGLQWDMELAQEEALPPGLMSVMKAHFADQSEPVDVEAGEEGGLITEASAVVLPASEQLTPLATAELEGAEKGGEDLPPARQILPPDLESAVEPATPIAGTPVDATKSLNPEIAVTPVPAEPLKNADPVKSIKLDVHNPPAPAPDIAKAVNPEPSAKPVISEVTPLQAENVAEEPFPEARKLSMQLAYEGKTQRTGAPEITLNSTRAFEFNMTPTAQTNMAPVVLPGVPGVTAATGTPPPVTLASQSLAAEMQPLQLSQTGNSVQWGEAIGERVAFLINHKLNSAEIRLDPPHLGKLDIQIQVKEDSAVIHINTQQAQTRDLIDNAGQRLREFLQEAGYNSVDVNVSHREQAGGQLAQDSGGSGNDGPGSEARGMDQSGESETRTFVSGPEQNCGIDFYA